MHDAYLWYRWVHNLLNNISVILFWVGHSQSYHLVTGRGGERERVNRLHPTEIEAVPAAGLSELLGVSSDLLHDLTPVERPALNVLDVVGAQLLLDVFQLNLVKAVNAFLSVIFVEQHQVNLLTDIEGLEIAELDISHESIL